MIVLGIIFQSPAMSVSITLSDVPTHIVFWKGAAEKESDLVKSLVDRIAKLEEMVEKLLHKELLSGLSMRRREDSIGSLSAVQESDMKNLFKELIEKPLAQEIESESILDTAFDLGDGEDEDVEDAEDAEDAEGDDDVDYADDEQEVDAEEDAEGTEAEEVEVEEVEVEADAEEVEADVEDEEADVEAEEVEEEEAEEEVEEALELDEFEYKGVTYFRDSENQVYQVDVDGDLDDTPIGVWSVEKAKVLKYAK